MVKLILKRLGLMIPLLILISIVVFSLAIIQPGDPFSDLQNGKIKQEAINAQREKLASTTLYHINTLDGSIMLYMVI